MVMCCQWAFFKTSICFYLLGSSLLKLLFSAAILKTGVAELDRLLSGGLYTGEVAEICGASLSGKTRACLRLAAETASTGKDVLFLTSSAGWVTHARCLADILAPRKTKNRRFDDDDDDNNEDAEEESVRLRSIRPAMERVQFVQVSHCFNLLQLLGQTRSFLRRKHSAVDNEKAGNNDVTNNREDNNNPLFPSQFQPSLLVIDSLDSIMSPLLGGQEIPSGLSFLASIGRELKLLALDFHLVVLVANHVVPTVPFASEANQREEEEDEAEAEEEVAKEAVESGDRPAMGLSWLNYPHVRVKLVTAKSGEDEGNRLKKRNMREEQSSSIMKKGGLEVYATLLRHSRIPCGKTKLLTI